MRLQLETFGLIEKADWDGMRAWMLQHAKEFRKKALKGARCNTVLLHWLKLGPELSKIGARFPQKLEAHLKNRKVAIQMLLEAWPEQATIADFKGQTPLMLVADNGDVELTKLLAPLSDIDAQDYIGRTALHAAVSGSSSECVALVLKCSPYVEDRVTIDEGNTALHTAARFGKPDNVRLILDEFPGLAGKANLTGKIPLKIAQEILVNLPRWRDYMQRQNRRIGTKEDFEKIVAYLEAEPSAVH